MKTKLELPVEAEKLVPHQKPARLVDRLVDYGKSVAVVEAVIEPDNMFLDEKGNLEPAVMIELIAQSFAAMKGYEDIRNNAGVKNGFLVGLRHVNFLKNASVGDRLMVNVKRVAEIEGFAVAEGEVKKGDQILASGSIKLWITEEGMK